MEIGNDELDWIDPYEDYDNQNEEEPQAQHEEPVNTEPPAEEAPSNEPQELDLVTRILNSKGISDLSKIKFEGDNGEIEEIDWNSLTIDEQFNIINQQDEPETGLDDDEIDLINEIRSAQLTPKEFKDYLFRQGAESVNTETTETYSIDDMSDDELFVWDLQARNEEITEEEAWDALSKAKTSESAFSKQIKGIRDDYKRLEDEQKLAIQQQEESRRKEQYEAFSNNIKTSIQSFKNIGNLDIELDNDEMDEIAQFLLTTDGAGINHFSKVLNDPNWLVRMAWFALKGEDAFNNIAEYFTTEMKQREQASYKKGLEEGAKKNPTSPKVVYQPTNNNTNDDRNYFSIDDLD